LREADTAGGQVVEVGRVDIAAIAAGVGESHVVGEDHEEVRFPRGRGGDGRGGGERLDEGAASLHASVRLSEFVKFGKRSVIVEG
jgi:hypothetical protein